MMASTIDHELHGMGRRQSIATSVPEGAGEAEGIHSEVDMRALPPTDHGKQAYLILTGCTLIQAPVWG
jgi:hypothetical protein